MGCNTSQELKTKKTDDESAGVGDKTTEDGGTEQTPTPIVNGDASADGDSSTSSPQPPPPPPPSTSVDDSCAIKNVPSLKSGTSSSGTTAIKNNISESEQNAKNNGIQNNKQQSKPSSAAAAGDVIDGSKHHNSLVNGDIKDDGHRTKLCEKAEITELNNVDIDGDEDENDDDEAKAATKIQAAFRGHKVRESMKKSDDTSAAATAATAKNNAPTKVDEKLMAAAAENADPTKEELEAEFDPNDKELCDAALKIQATFRGHLSRKLVGQKAEDVDIQEITKKVAEELDIDLTDPELNKAATKIQASFRGHKSRKDN